MKYSVYYSDTDNIMTVSDLLKTEKIALSDGRPVVCDFVQPKDPTGTNYINVLVEDEAETKLL